MFIEEVVWLQRILLIHLFVRHRSVQLRIFWRSFSRSVFNPVKKVWNKYVAD